MFLDYNLVSFRSVQTLSVAAFFVWLLYQIGLAVYNVTLHPLAKHPGPKLWGALRLPYNMSVFAGTQSMDIHRLHEMYGQVVRIAPNNLSFTDGRAWKDIYGSRPGKGQMEKRTLFFANDKLSKMPKHILAANDADHSRFRRLLSHAFSDQALRSQEGILNTYFRLLLEKLDKEIDGPNQGKVDMVGYYNFTTFDIIGDLAFGEPFYALDAGKYHPWIANTFHLIKAGRWLRLAGQYSIAKMIFRLMSCFKPVVGKARATHLRFTTERVESRLNVESDRKDFIDYIHRNNDEKGMTRAEIISNSGVLIIAGSETTATLLAGATYYLLQNPEKMARLQKEVRSSFNSTEEMTLVSTSRLPYLQAVIEEGLRMYPPVPIQLTRATPLEGAIIAGEFVPGDVTVGVHHFSAYRDSNNWVDPFAFAPERFLPDPPAKYAGEKRDALQPFSYGPRNCLGKNLAYNEMRSILARVMFEYDMELCPESQNWADQKVITLWQKPRLMVQLRRREQKAS